MKCFAMMICLCLFAATSGADELKCAAHVNEKAIKLQQTFPGFFIIDAKDPLFEAFDVIIDATSLPRVQVRMAKFTDSATIESMKKVSANLSTQEQAAFLSLLKPRVVDTTAALRPNGVAIFSLKQGDETLSVHCGIL